MVVNEGMEIKTGKNAVFSTSSRENINQILKCFLAIDIDIGSLSSVSKFKLILILYLLLDKHG